MRHTTLITLLAAPLALAACDSGQDTAEMEDMPMAEDAMMMDGQDMPMADTGNAMQSASAQGTVTAIDAEAGTITVDHGPVPAIEWPAMTMPFASKDRNSCAVLRAATGSPSHLCKPVRGRASSRSGKSANDRAHHR